MTDRQTDIQTNRQTDRQIETEGERIISHMSECAFYDTEVHLYPLLSKDCFISECTCIYRFTVKHFWLFRAVLSFLNLLD